MSQAAGATIRPIETSGRRDAIVQSLTQFIVQSDLKPGDQLPPERELMTGLKVGRSSIREAIGHMQALGIVEIKRGSGTYLKRPVSEQTLFMPLSIATQRDGLLQTLEVRRGLEVEASMLAAKRATQEDIAGQADLVYHLSIYKASGNPLFEQLLGQMRETFESFFAKPFNRSDFARDSFEFHRMLFDAIVARDPESARQHTLAILEIVENDIVRMSNEQQ